MKKYMTLTADEAIRLLGEVSTDSEVGHGDADDILLAFIRGVAPEVEIAWRAAEDRVGFWYA